MSDMVKIALPKGRILNEICNFLARAGIIVDDEIHNESSRNLIFKTNHTNIDVVRIRNSDIMTLISFGAVDLAICGNDIIEEYNSPNIYNLINLKIGQCRLSIAKTKLNSNMELPKNHIKITTKYKNIVEKYFNSMGVQTDIIKLNGAIEIAPSIGLSDYIADLVSTGRSLEENHLKEIVKIMDVSSYLIANKTFFKSKNAMIVEIMEKICKI